MAFQYKHFKNAELREAMKGASANIAGFARGNKVSHILIAGRSGWVARLCVAEAWKRLHPDEPRPKIYSLQNALTEAKWNDAKLKRILKPVADSKPKGVMLLDEAIYSGNTLEGGRQRILKALEGTGRAPRIYTVALLGNPKDFENPPDAIGGEWADSFGAHYLRLSEMIRNHRETGSPSNQELKQRLKQIASEIKQMASEIKPRK